MGVGSSPLGPEAAPPRLLSLWRTPGSFTTMSWQAGELRMKGVAIMADRVGVSCWRCNRQSLVIAVEVDDGLRWVCSGGRDVPEIFDGR